MDVTKLTPKEKEEARQRLVEFSDLSQYQEDLYTVLCVEIAAREAIRRVSLLEQEVATLEEKNSVLERKLDGRQSRVTFWQQENIRLQKKIGDLEAFISTVKVFPKKSKTKKEEDEKLINDIALTHLDFQRALSELNKDYPGLKKSKGKRRKSPK